MIRSDSGSTGNRSCGLITLCRSADNALVSGVLIDDKPLESGGADHLARSDNRWREAAPPSEDDHFPWACTTPFVDDDRAIGRAPSEETVYVGGQPHVFSLRPSPSSRKHTARSHAERNNGGAAAEIAFFGLVPKA